MLLVRNKGILGWKYRSGGWKTQVAAEGGSLRSLPPGAGDRPGSCDPKDAWVTCVLGEWAGLSSTSARTPGSRKRVTFLGCVRKIFLDEVESCVLEGKHPSSLLSLGHCLGRETETRVPAQPPLATENSSLGSGGQDGS